MKKITILALLLTWGTATQLRLLFNQRAELVKGIEGHKLNAATVVDLGAAYLLFGMVHQAMGT